MSILQNVIDSIQVGIDDYKNTDDRRSVSAVRNIRVKSSGSNLYPWH
jgi:hypothetical protein